MTRVVEVAGMTPTIEFLDCETVRVSGDAAAVLLHLSWLDEEGLEGTIAEPVGGVDGERTIVASEEFGEFAHGPVVHTVEIFEEGPATPGLGDHSRENPDDEACRKAMEAELEGEQSESAAE